MTGIYRIKNMINGKCYVGKSEINIEDRWKRHIYYLRNDKHLNYNGKRDKLQRAWNKYGEENFIFGVIEECLPEECNEKEIYWIDYYDSFHNGYNQTEGGEGTSGYKHTEKSKQKMSDNHAFKGKHLSKEHRQKISESIKGENHPMYGNHHSEETKKKMSESISESIKGEKHPMYGKHHSEETKRKISESMSEATKGEKNHQWIPITEEMIFDYRNGISKKDFCNKYQVSGRIWHKLIKSVI